MAKLHKYYAHNRTIVNRDIEHVMDEIMTLTNQKLEAHIWSDDGNSLMQVVDQITKIPIVMVHDDRWDTSIFTMFGLKKRDLYHRLVAYRDGYKLRLEQEERERTRFQSEKQASEPVYGQTGSARLNR